MNKETHVSLLYPELFLIYGMEYVTQESEQLDELLMMEDFDECNTERSRHKYMVIAWMILGYDCLASRSSYLHIPLCLYVYVSFYITRSTSSIVGSINLLQKSSLATIKPYISLFESSGGTIPGHIQLVDLLVHYPRCVCGAVSNLNAKKSNTAGVSNSRSYLSPLIASFST